MAVALCGAAAASRFVYVLSHAKGIGIFEREAQARAEARSAASGV